MMTTKKEGYPKYAPGTHVSTKDIVNKNIAYSWWEPEVQYSWALGPANSRFLQELKNKSRRKDIRKRCEEALKRWNDSKFL